VAAPDFTVSRLGQINAAGDTDAMFLKVFPGEVLSAFEIENVMLSRTRVRTISHGKSAQFPAVGRAAATYHTPGVTMTGAAIKQAEIVVTIDGLAKSDVFVANIDEAMNHYDLRSEYATEMGRALAVLMDQNIFRMGILGAAASATVDSMSIGTRAVTYDDEATNAADLLVGKIFDGATLLNVNSVPKSDRFVAVAPAEYYGFVQAAKLVNKDYTSGNGGVDSGTILRIAGISVVDTNNLPTADDSANTDIPSQYRADFQKQKALIWHRSAIGTVKLIDLQLEKAYQIREQGTFMVAKYSCGHKYLRPEALYSIKGD
jgi:hypothetical protein